jgi:transposase
MTTRTVHTTEFKRDAVQLARTSGNISGTARDLGINVSLLRKWMTAEQEHGLAAFPGHGQQVLSVDQQEIRRLRKEIEILRQEREILKKATACLGQNGTRMGPARFFAREITR